MSIAARLRDLKDRSGLTEAELAARAGIPFGTLHGYIVGRRRVSAENLIKLAKTLGVDPGELLGGGRGTDRTENRGPVRKTIRGRRPGRRPAGGGSG